ncbi:MAG: hypothetical protein JJ896_11885 [Rhodothermales bacterium]|nr:hypothetical protein [Rhodothermales bacterium]MBO6780345.1 hypothetical protein [Rhodothermales bacterium]
MPIHSKPLRDGLLVTCTGSIRIGEFMETHAANYASGVNARFVLADLTGVDELDVTLRELAFLAVHDAGAGAMAQGVRIAIVVKNEAIKSKVFEYRRNVASAGRDNTGWAMELFPDMDSAEAWCQAEVVEK